MYSLQENQLKEIEKRHKKHKNVFCITVGLPMDEKKNFEGGLVNTERVSSNSISTVLEHKREVNSNRYERLHYIT